MSTPPTSAALDLGSNSVHLLVARADPEGRPLTLLDVSHQAPIGRTVVTTGELGAELREELVATVADYVDQARALGSTTMLLLGTEAVRRASDAIALATQLQAVTGIPVTVLDRTTEGLLTLLGVTGGRVLPSLAVVDIGGGSTEVTMLGPDGQPVVGVVPVGSAHLALAHIHHDPVTDAEIATLRAASRTHVAALDVPRPERAIVAGGSGTNVSRLLGRERTTPIDRAAIEEGFALLRAHPAEELAARTGLTVRRVGQLAAGLAIDEALFERLGLEIAEVSDASLREGALIATWTAGDAWLDGLTALVTGSPGGRRVDPATDGQDRAS
jgi:exopolyphosphatase/guanosine-5'-triphosphate,3'-diphosphate pyrophosphatase